MKSAKVVIGKVHKLFNSDVPFPKSQQKASTPAAGATNANNAPSTPAVSGSILGANGASSTQAIGGGIPPADIFSIIHDPSAVDIRRYRYHHGTNLGSVYVLERWLFPSRFPPESTGSSELEAVKAWVAKIGASDTKSLFESAWAHAASDADLKWLKSEARCTSVRLPIGYWDLPGEEFTKGTPFEPYAQVYSDAWESICSLISRLRQHDIGVLLDLHALPGGANTKDHSGTNSGVAEFFTSSTYRKLGISCAGFIARQSAAGLEIVGLSLVNEPIKESENLYAWYEDAIEAVSAIDPDLPVIISDAWDLSRAVEYSLRKNVAFPAKPIAPIVIDTHMYWCFNEADKQKTPQEIVKEVPTKLAELGLKQGSVTDCGAVQVIVGEYSNAISADSWNKVGETTKDDVIRIFGSKQSLLYQKRTGGAFFWTWKMEWMPGGEWGLMAQAEPRNRFIFPPQHAHMPERSIPTILEFARNGRDEDMSQALAQHRSYYTHFVQNKLRDPRWFKHGWRVGYNDAYVFFEGKGADGVRPGNKIGNVEIWVLKRIRDSGFKGRFVWDFEQGIRRGIHDFNASAGI